MQFKDRREAGIKLSERLKKYKNNKEVIVLAIPRGGVGIGCEIAKFLNAELDIIVAKKIGLPDDDEYAIGVVGPDKKVILNEAESNRYNVPKDYIREKAKEIGKEIARRYKEYKGDYRRLDLRNKIVILTDDGIATGFTAKAAIAYIKSQDPKKIILAIPVAPLDAAEGFRKQVDEFVCLHSPDRFFSISQFYENFGQLSDEDVKNYLKKGNKISESKSI